MYMIKNNLEIILALIFISVNTIVLAESSDDTELCGIQMEGKQTLVGGQCLRVLYCWLQFRISIYSVNFTPFNACHLVLKSCTVYIYCACSGVDAVQTKALRRVHPPTGALHCCPLPPHWSQHLLSLLGAPSHRPQVDIQLSSSYSNYCFCPVPAPAPAPAEADIWLDERAPRGSEDLQSCVAKYKRGDD